MLEKIKAKIELLIARYEQALSENQNLREQISALNAENEQYRKQITELDQQIDSLKLKEAFTAPAAGSSEAKAKIGQMIKDIDKCIALLEKS